MVPIKKFVIGKSKSSRLLSLEQRILGYNRQLTKLNTKVEMISAWLTKKFGVSFLVETSDKVELEIVAKQLSLVRSRAQHSSSAGVKRAKQNAQSVSGGGQDLGSDVSAESDIMVDSNSDPDVVEADKDAETSVREPADDAIPLEDSAAKSERRIKRQRKRKGQEGNGTKKQRPRSTLADQNYQTQDIRRQKHSCSWPNCKKCFSSSGLLTIHNRTHTGEKPYVCDWPNCDKSYAQSSALKVHRRTHTGERPFHCGFCDYRFVSATNLTRHIRIHTGEKPYKCRVCAATFTQSNNKVRHEKVHHRSH